jgi:hypothetical protein
LAAARLPLVHCKLPGTCKAALLPNGDFEGDKSIDATALMGWAKLKENA